MASLATPAVEQPWYLAKTHLAKEALAIENLVRQGFETYMPLRLVRTRHNEAAARPLFPRHVFFRVGMTGEGWRKVFSTRGVQSVYRSGDHPAIVPLKVIARLKAEEDGGLIKIFDPKIAAAQQVKALFAPGARIKIKTGAMEGLDAIFQEGLDANRVAILVRLLGRETRVTLELDTITARD